MYYSYVEIEYIATSFSPARADLAFKLLTACLVGLRSHSQSHWGRCSTRTGPKYVGSLVCTESLRMYVGYINSFSICFLSIPTILYISYLLKYISYLQ
jgi:hypothetical protein